ncbi:polysaccharide pyruvyl transferase family protein [Colwellia sp. RSH04]|uniref:polysaccharide pyruvyl transferase family protein n=1 Tax=Colwellia sp. RSH04 TaxID=2305464 RepID=UPI000E581CE1|nr:polysaccharide pyruvyl transferase family protein [Colwellia sp. RSH04]RHW74907.1 polysaccharide pyruvyl transferase family protein [Colwellia sp. RSH04]
MKLEKNKKILFVRHFGVISNLGDKLISKATEEYLLRLSEKEDFEYKTAAFVPYTKFGKFNLSNMIKGFFYSLKQACGVNRIVIIGGNLVIPNNTKFSLCFFFYFLISKVFKVKLSAFGIGVSESKGKDTWRTRLYQIAISSCDYISVRDEHSLFATRKLLGKNKPSISLTHDCAFLFNDSYYEKHVSSGAVAIIPVNYFSATCNENVITLTEKEYQEFHIELIKAVLATGKRPFVLCTDKTDEQFAQLIAKSFDLQVITPETVDELFSLLKGVDVIGARMHGIIASLLTGCKVVGLNWQYKVKSLSQKEQLGFSCINYEMQNIQQILIQLNTLKSKSIGNGIKDTYQHLNEDLEKLVKL